MKNIAPIVLLFSLLVTLMMFPLVVKINTHIPGFFSSDENFAPLWDSWRIRYSFLNNISFRQTPLIAYPFGRNLYDSGYTSYLWTILFYSLSLLTTSVLTYNIQVFTNFFLSALFTYVLVLYLTRNRLSAFFSGIIFSFCPYQFARTWQHLSLTHNQWIPLCLLAIILLKNGGTRKNIILFLASLLLLFTFDFSVMYLGAVTLLLFFIYAIFFQSKIKFLKKKYHLKEDLKFIKNIAIAVFFATVILAPQFSLVIKNRFKLSTASSPSAYNPYHRPFEDLFTQSAKPLSYLLPATVHPIFGKFTEQFIGTQLYGMSFTEHTLYLGWTPLFLAFFAWRQWARKRKIKNQISNIKNDNREDFYIGFFIFLAVVAWLFSQPPWWDIGGFKIYMPSFFMYKILPMYRAYCRFGIIVMLAVAILAGFGLKFILERFKSQGVKIMVAVLFCGLVLFEFWNWPPYKVIDVSRVPAVYYWLKAQPGDLAIAEYPLDADSPNEMYKFYQTKHEKKIINGTIPGTYANKFAKSIISLSSPDIAGILKWMGVKYILVHHDGYVQTELTQDKEELEKIPDNRALKLVRSFPAQGCPQKDTMCVQATGQIDVYEIREVTQQQPLNTKAQRSEKKKPKR